MLFCAKERTFSQTKGKRQVSDEATREAVEEGCSRGACLHWLRLSLNKDQKALSLSDENANQVSRMATTQAKWDETLDVAHKEFVNRLQDKVRRRHDHWFGHEAVSRLENFLAWVRELNCAYIVEVNPPPGKFTITLVPPSKLNAESLRQIEERKKQLLKEAKPEARRYALEQAKSFAKKKEQLEDQLA
jgi:hypothetical protein